MRYSFLLPALASLAIAQDLVAVANNPDPTPDALPLENLRDIPVPTYTVATGVTAQDIPYATSSAIALVVSEVAATPLSVFPAATDVPINSAGENGTENDEDASANVIVNTGSKLKRALSGIARQSRYKRDACKAQPTIANTYNVDVSASDAFTADANIAYISNNATTPGGYYENFKNKQSANSAMNYLGYYVLPSATYDTKWCADKCDAKAGCLAFNIYFERDPTVDPGANCPNPEAFANIKCSLWGTGLDEKTLTNPGQWREKFWVAIAGSNAYTSYKLGGPVEGWNGPQDLGTKALNAPLWDCENKWSYLGYKLLQAGSVDPRLCAAACDAQTEFNKAHPTAADPYACNAFGSYILTKKNSTGSYQQGQMCTFYTAYWDAKYAKNTGSSDPTIGATYSYSHSFFYGKKSAQLSCAADFQSSTGTYIKGGVDKKASIKAASLAVIASSLQPYCSSILGYTVLVTTVTVTSTSTPLAITASTNVQTDSVTVTSTEAFTATVTVTKAKRDVANAVETPTELTVISGTTALALPTASTVAEKRAISQPSALSNYPADIVTLACSAAVQSATTTNVITSTVTATAETAYTVEVTQSTKTVTVIVTLSSTVTETAVLTPTALVCPNKYNFVISGGSRNGHVIGADHPASDFTYGFVYPTYDVSKAASYTVRNDGTVYGGANEFGWSTYTNMLYWALEMTDAATSLYGLTRVKCAIGSEAPVGVTGAVGLLDCTVGSAAADLYVCSNPYGWSGDYLFQGPRGSATNFLDCKAISVAAVPATIC